MGESTTTSQQQYPSFVEDFGRGLFNKANKAFKQGPHYFKGSTTTPMAGQTTSAFGYDSKGNLTGGGMMGLAGSNSNGAGMSPYLQEIMSGGGFNAGQRESIGGLRDLANNGGLSQIINDVNGMTAVQNKAYSGLQNTVAGNNNALQQTFNQGGLTDDQRLVADKYRTGMNEQFGLDPAYLQVKQNALDATAQGVTGQAARAGRFGGGANQNILARAQGDLAANMDVGERDKWLARTNAAAGNLAGLSQTGLGNQLGINTAQQQGYSNIADMGAMGVGQRNDAINVKAGLEQAIFNAENAGLDRMGQAYQTAMQPYQTQRAVGQEYEDLFTRQMQDNLRKFDAKNPFNHLQQYSSLLSGAPMNTVQTQNPSWLNTIAGGLLAGSAFL